MALTDIAAHSTLKTGLLAYYKMEGNARDSWGTNNGTAEKAITTVAGKLYNAIAFDGNGDPPDPKGTCQTIDLGQLIAGLGSFSISYWAKLNSVTPYAVHLSLASWEETYWHASNRLFVQQPSGSSGNVDFGYWGATGPLWIAAPITNGSWVNWVITVDYVPGTGITTFKVYKNGVAVAAKSGSIGGVKSSTMPLLIGSAHYMYGSNQRLQACNGTIDEIAVANRAWTASEVSDLYNSGYGLPLERQPSIKNHPTLKNDLVAYWTMDAGGADSFTNNLPLTISGSPSYIAGKLRTGMSLTAFGQKATRTGDAIFNLNGNRRTMSLWFYARTLPSSGVLAMLFGRNYDIGAGRLYVKGDDSKIHYDSRIDPTWTPSSITGPTITANTWYHVVILQERSNESTSRIRMIVNGTEYDSSNFSTSNFDSNIVTGDIYIGAEGGDSADRLDGIIDEVVYWNQTKTDAEVADLYNGGIGMTWDSSYIGISDHPTLMSGLLAHYKFDGNAADALGNYGFVSWMGGVWTYKPSKLDEAAFGNSNGYLRGTNNAVLNPAKMSLVCWAKRPAVNLWGWAVNRGAYELGYNGNPGVYGMYWKVGKSGYGDTMVYLPCSDDSWHFYAGSYDGASVVKASVDNGVPVTTSWTYGITGSGSYLEAVWANSTSLQTGCDGLSIYDRVLDPSEIANLYNCGEGLRFVGQPRDINTSPTLKIGMVSYWKLDENANDCVGSHHGTLENSPSNVTAKLRKGYNLVKASSQAISIPHHADFNTQAFSYSIWYKPNSIDSGVPGMVIAKRNYDASRHMFCYQHLQSATPGTYFSVWTSGGSFDVAGTQPTVGVWRHAVLVCSGTEIKLYENGVLKGTTAITGTVNYISDDLTLGRLSGSSNFSRFDGVIDEPAFWNRALTANEVTQLYNRGVGLTWDASFTCISEHPSLTNGMVCGYPLNDVRDVGPNGFHGSIEGYPTIVPGKRGNCFRLNGQNQVVNLGSDLKMAPTAGITVACWAKIEGAAARQWQNPISRFYYGWNAPVGESGTCWGLQFDRTSKQWGWFVGNGTTSSSVAKVLDTEGVWVHLLGLWTGTYLQLFMNGVEVGTPMAFTGPINQYPGILTIIGSRMGDGNWPPQGRYDYMNGKVDEVYIWDRPLDKVEISELYAGGAALPYTPPVTYSSILEHPTLKNGLISHFAFEDNVNDSQGNFNGTAVGTPTYEPGKVGSKAIRLNGSTQYVDLGNDTRLNPGCITVASWVKMSSFGTNPGVIVRKDSVDWSYALIGGGANILYWYTKTSGGYDYVSMNWPTPITDWHLLVGTYDGSYLRLSVDGEEITEKKHTYEGRIAYVRDVHVLLGIDIGDPSPYLNGWLDGMMIWDRALTRSEIRALYNNGAGLPFGTITPATTMATHRSLLHGLISVHELNNSLLDSFCVNDGVMGSGVPAYNTGKFPSTQALDLSGAAGQFVVMPTGAAHRHRYLGVAGWVWLDGVSGVQEIVCKRDNNANVWDIYGGANWTFGCTISGGEYVNMTRVEGSGQWHFFCGYFDGRTLFLRVNERIATSSYTGLIISNSTADAVKVRIGAAGNAGGDGDYRFDGRVCNIAIWDRPLMPSEITDLWNSGNGLPFGTIAAPTGIDAHLTMKEDLVGHWSFDANANEDSGSYIDGTLVNTPLFQAGKVGNAMRISQPHTHEHVWFDPAKLDPHFNVRRFSVGFWVYFFEHPKTEGGGDHRYSAIVAKSAYTGYDWIQFHLLHWSVSDGSTIEIYCRDSSDVYKGVSVANLVVLNTWMHIAGVYDGKEIALFKNGVCVGRASFTSGVRFIEYPLRLGFRGNGAGMTNIIIPDSMMGCSKKDLDQFAFASRAWTYKEVADLYNRGSGIPYVSPVGSPPNVASASATGNTTIRITYDKEVKHSSSGGQYDSLNPANYEFAGDVAIDATDVDLVTESPTVVDVTVDGEMTLGESYLVTVSNVQDLEDRGLAEDTASFSGHGTRPQAASCAVLTSRKIRIVFDSLMTHNGALTDPGSYTFDGGLTAASGIIATDEGGVTKVEVPFTGSVTHGTTYHCEVSLVMDLSENVIDSDHDTVSFTGLSPRVVSAALVAGKIRLTFNSEMKHSDDEDLTDALYVAGYSVDGPTELTITGVTLVDDEPATIVDLVFTGEMTDGEDYTVTATCQHVTGSPLDVDEGIFTGSGTYPQLVEVDFILPDVLVFVFNKFMKEDDALVNPENYSIPVGPTPLTISNPVVANAVDHTTVRTTILGSIRKNGAYTAQVIGVTDTAENPIDLEHNLAEFVGQVPGVFKAPVWLSPPGEKIFGSVMAPGTQVQEVKEEDQ